MVNPTTPNLQLEVPLRGAEVGTWDTPVNSDFTILDTAFGGVTTVAVSTAAVTLASSQAQASVLRFTGALTASITVTVPSSLIRKFWIAENLTTGSSAFVIQLQNNSTGQVIALPPGEPVDVVSDGTNMKFRNLGRVGSYLDVAATSVPLWIGNCTVPPYLNCDGTAFSSATYPYLALQLGGTTLPDYRGRSRAYLNQGTGRLTSASGGVDGNTLLAAGGNESIVMASSGMPAHVHGVTDPSHAHAPVGGTIYAGAGFQGAAGGGTFQAPNNVIDLAAQTTTFALTGISIQSAGGGGGHPNVQPTTIGGITLIRAM